MRLHTTSAGLDPTRLAPGRDLTLTLAPVHGTDAPNGTYVLDALDADARAEADLLSVQAMHDWLAHVGEDLTIDGIDWPFVWTLPLLRVLNPGIACALGLQRALSRHGAREIELQDSDPDTALLAAIVARQLGLRVRTADGAREPAVAQVQHAAVPRRRAFANAIAGLGAPSHLRADAVLFHSYWPLMPLLDRMLQEPGQRPAVFLAKRPTGARRTLQTMRRGGWIGLPTAADRRHARAGVPRITEVLGRGISVDAGGLELGAWLGPRIAAALGRRMAGDLADAALLRRSLRSRPPRCVVGGYDVDASARLLVVLAQEAGVHTLMLSHGAFLLPQLISDLDVCDEVALWTDHIAPPITNHDRPIHRVGYPLPHDRPPATRRRRMDGGRPRIGILGQLGVAGTCTLDDRVTMDVYETALGAVAQRFPDATVLVRPHPVQDRATIKAVVERFPALDIHEATGGDILDFHAGVDLCIGGATTATLQAALVGTPLVVLNLSGTAWSYPLGGDTAVPIARSAPALDAALGRWERDGMLPGRDDLLAALGADGSDGVARLRAILDGIADRTAAPRSAVRA